MNKFYKILSTNTDRNRKEFVSSIEGVALLKFLVLFSLAINYPFYGVQWHPEKNVFEWSNHEDINHTFHAILIAQTVANFFVQESRKSNHQFINEDAETDSLIYNYPATFTGRKTNFEQVYVF